MEQKFDVFFNYGPNSPLWNGHAGMAAGWYWQPLGTYYAEDGSCHPECGPIVRDVYDIRGKAPLLSDSGEHAHENADGRCWHESWCEPQGPFPTRQVALDDAERAEVSK